ncbi:trypsin-like peptidase domain-containing protein [Catenovulum sp. SM1970]|uniref:S1 family peptidase n=1 Tax=Marinifaba aquimaris TaxID=2741323 RepID=UPI001574B9C9|nr:serine protease [Marinifaba aquimaris]NTS75463.1 trypsin-like peptidase domain-containing protein [Marinifaba aquimaris]
MACSKHVFIYLIFLLFTYSKSLSANEAINQPNNDAQSLFSEYAQQVVQVQVIETSSGNKTAIGSGFYVADSKTVATNFHVISHAIHQPEHYKIELETADKQRHSASISNFDIVNDLALLKTTHQVKPLELAQAEPIQGNQAYSIGNPSDYGMIVVPGIYNGITNKSYYQRIHFTGAINSGMSGGPVLNEQGQIIGVNVATSGNAIGFLVPLAKLNTLVSNPELVLTEGQSAKSQYAKQIELQLLASQADKIDKLLAQPWKEIDLGDAHVFSEVAPFIPCWGDSNAADEDAHFFASSVICSSKEYIYIKPKFLTGRVEVAFTWFENKQLNSFQFYNLLEAKFASVGPGNSARDDDVSNYHCHQDFQQLNQSVHINKAVLCTRAYKEYPELFDLLFIAVTASDNNKALLSHFTLAGVSKSSSLAFTEKFMDKISWK